MKIEIADNKIIENAIDSFNYIFELIAKVTGWARLEIKAFNDFQKRFEMLVRLAGKTPDKDNTPIIHFEEGREEVLKAWDTWKKHLAHNDVYYSAYNETCALRVITRLTDGNWQNFVYVIEYAVMNNYIKIQPEILNYAIPTARPALKTLFKDSPVYNFATFKKSFGKVYSNVDLRFYYDKLYMWSNSQSRVSADWIATAKSFIQKDALADKEVLACINNKLRNETKRDILGRSPKAQAIDLLNRNFTYIRTLSPEFWQNIRPLEFNNDVLTISFDFEKSKLNHSQVTNCIQLLANQFTTCEGKPIAVKITNMPQQQQLAEATTAAAATILNTQPEEPTDDERKEIAKVIARIKAGK